MLKCRRVTNTAQVGRKRLLDPAELMASAWGENTVSHSNPEGGN